ncbi:DNA polymerase I [Coprococcus sp. CLA-AA-H212]|uniref:DNA polymerase I n=1 Tax=Coprococcus hominis (ex Arizal et al. 2022) TaxID=2881262 RepID=A0ABS8FKG3_9FIRM|nr:DNA polymerase I [Coprococcus hominis (ex Arizal et al. 2022)]MCC2217698.1 DNA polymerase I [Coprococcus hominis (ex Arizal et al. 2022)]
MNKLLLIDGNSIMNRAFYGIPDMTTNDGRHTNAIYGFLNIILKVIEEEQATHICVAFDLKKKTFRHEMYEAYKGTRKGMPEELHEQMPRIKEILQAMHIRIVEQEGFEADDLIGTLSKKGEREGFAVTILSGDRDLLQLATDTVLVRIPKTKHGKTEVEDYYAKNVVETYGVTPLIFIDMKGLMGDTSDNIPGVPGIGEKTAAKLLAEYGDLDGVYAAVDSMKASRMKQNLIENKDLAYLSKTLATIKLDCPIPFEFSEATYHDPFNAEAYTLFEDLELKSFYKRFSVEKKEELTFETVLIDDIDGYNALLAKLQKAKEVSFAWITQDGEALGVAVCMDLEHVYLIRFMMFITEAMVADNLLALSRDYQVQLACMHVKKLLSFLDFHEEDAVFDAGLAAYLLQPNQSEYEYDTLAKVYLDVTLPSEKEMLGKEKLGYFSFEDEKVQKWMAYQAIVPYKIKSVLREKLKETGMESLYDEMELPCLYALYEMEKNGIRVDGEALHQYGKKLRTRIEELTAEIHAMAGEEFNINSPKKLGEILFEKLGLKNGKKTKTGYSTSAEVLEKLKNAHPIIPKILEYRQLTKLNSTYAEGLAGYIRADGRIHGKFHQTVTVTGRISSADPNLQNIPTRMPLGREIRKVFIPEEGSVFVDADYSQIELRVLAHMSGDAALIAAYQADEDIHAITASQVFDVPLDQVDSTLRRKAKAVNFGIVYGISSFGLGQDLDISRKEAEGYIEKYFATYGKVKEFLDRTVEDAKKNGYTVTMFGRRRPIPELASSNFMTRSFGERAAMNAPVQGTAADIIKIAMVRVNRRLKKEHLQSKLVLQIHDELIIETKKEELEIVQKILVQEMMHAADLVVPLLVDANVGDSWYDAK